jgi:host factor-I protein
MPKEKQSLQDEYLNAVRKDEKNVFVHLTTGREIYGTIKAFDNFTILVSARNGELLIYKSAIGVIGPAGKPPAKEQS